MTPPSDEQLNEQAVAAATAALSEPVVAATRCEFITEDRIAKAAGAGRLSRVMDRVSRQLGTAFQRSTGTMAERFETGDLPDSFVLAVTAERVCALEERRDGDNLAVGDALASWGRAGLLAKRGTPSMDAWRGVSD